MKRLQSLVFPNLNFRLIRWPFSKANALKLDLVQRKMVGICLNLRPAAGESIDSFWRRKYRNISIHVNKRRWSGVWATRVVSWHVQVTRNTGGRCWSAQLASVLTLGDLNSFRLGNHGRPCTRVSPGWSSIRWYESVARAKAFLVEGGITEPSDSTCSRL